jgi:hypothetical protein
MNNQAVAIIGGGQLGICAAGIFSGWGIGTMVLSDSLSSGKWGVRVGGDARTSGGEFAAVSRDAARTVDCPSVIVLARPAGFSGEDRAFISAAWPAFGSAIFTLANGLGDNDLIGMRPVILNFGISGNSDYKDSKAGIRVRSVGTKFVDGGYPGREFASVYNRAGLPIETVGLDQFIPHLHRTVGLNCVANSLSAITGLGPRELAENGPLESAVNEIWQEAAEVLGLEQDPDACREWLAAGGDHVPSSGQAVGNGGVTDFSFLNGAIVEHGLRQGVQVRRNRLAFNLASSRMRLSPRDVADCFAGLN